MSRIGQPAERAQCPNCGVARAASERFCPDCRLPLVPDPGTGSRADPRHDRARKVKPQLGEGALVRVASARNQAEAEFIQGLLLEEGVPSLLRRSAGFDVPDFLAAGPRDVLVPASGVATAREVLLEADLIAPSAGRTGPRPSRLLAGLVLALAAGALLVWVASLVLSR